MSRSSALVVAASLALGVSFGSPARAAAPPKERHLTLLHLADSHAQLETHPEYLPGARPAYQPMGGYARLKTAIDRERADAKADATFLVDGGDTFQGSAPAAWSSGEAVVAPLNGLGPDVCVPGNWEVVYGPDAFRKLMGELSCHVVAYNFHDAKSGERLFPPAAVLERGGGKVAFVGITDPTTTQRQPPEQVRGLDSTRMAGLRDFVRELKAREHPDVTVAVTHTGLTVSRALAREIPEFDVVLSGHTHERTERAILEGKTIVVEPGSMGSFLGRLDLTVGPEGIVRHAFRLVPVLASRYPEDPAEKRLVEKAVAPFRARMETVVGRSRTPIARYDVLETSADDLVSDAVREAAGADIGATNGFRFAPPIPAGKVTEGQLWSLLPLDARMKVGWVTGRELRAYLERELELVFSDDPWKLSGGWGPRLSGVELRFAAHAPAGQRVVSVKVGGRPLEDERHYSFAGCERAGEPLDVVCRMAGVHDVRVLPGGIHAALDGYFRAHREVSPTREGRAAAVDLPGRVFSQDAVLSERSARR